MQEIVIKSLIELSNFYKMTIEEFVKNGSSANFNEASKAWITMCNELADEHHTTPATIADWAWKCKNI